MTASWRRLVGILIAAIAADGGRSVVVHAQGQPPVFRSGTDLILVDVQVIDGKGVPVLGLGPDRFDVSINGRPRRVLSAELVKYDTSRLSGLPEKPATVSTRGETTAASGAAVPATRGRVFMLAVDERSFLPGYANGVLEAARGFMDRLQPSDLLGFVSYPSGAVVSPATDRAVVLAQLKRTAGQRQLPVTRFNLRPSDVVTLSRKIVDISSFDFNIKQHPDLEPILVTYCPPDGEYPQGQCFVILAQEVQSLYSYFEAEAAMSLGTLRGVIGGLAQIEGRKNLVLLSGGMVASDQAGGRPDLGNLGILLAQDAARANVRLDTLFVDWKFLEKYSAANARLSPTLQNLSRDTSINSQWLDSMSTIAGGKLFTISAGNGDFAFNRILSESAAYYLLGVEPDPADRDGRPRQLNVKVKQRGVTVRARTWVTVKDDARLASAAPVPPTAVAAPASAPVVLAASPTPPLSVESPTPAAPTVAAAKPEPVVTPAVTSAPPAPAVVPVTDSAMLPMLARVGAYVAHFDDVFSNVVTEERYLQVVTPGGNVARRESVSDFLLLTLPGTHTRVPYRDAFEVNGSPIRDRQQRLVDIFTRPDASTLARENALFRESASFNIGISRTVNLPTLGLEVLRADMQPRFAFSKGPIDSSAGAPAEIIVFTEVAHPSVITGRGGGDLLMNGRIWIDAASGHVVKTELQLDDIAFSASIVTVYRFDQEFGVAVPAEMREEYLERGGQRTTGTATYGRFRRFAVETTDQMVPAR